LAISTLLLLLNHVLPLPVGAAAQSLFEAVPAEDCAILDLGSGSSDSGTSADGGGMISTAIRPEHLVVRCHDIVLLLCCGTGPCTGMVASRLVPFYNYVLGFKQGNCVPFRQSC
jgi:hypothetical protein